MPFRQNRGARPLRPKVNHLKGNNTRRNSGYVIWTGGIFLCLFAVLLTLLLSSCGGSETPVTTPPAPAQESVNPESPGGESTDPGAVTTDPGTAATDPGAAGPSDPAGQTTGQSGTILGETPDAGQAYIDKLTFIGDSTTYGLWYYSNEAPLLTGELESEQVWTPASGTLSLFNYATATVRCPTPDGPEISIAEACALKQPEYLVITLGVNGVAMMDEDYFKECYTGVINIVKENSPNTKIICNSIYPVGRSYAQLDSINNEKINAANEWIKEVAAATGTKYSDTCSVLKDAEGWLPDNLQNGDYIHLNAQGFQLVLQYLRTHAYI